MARTNRNLRRYALGGTAMGIALASVAAIAAPGAPPPPPPAAQQLNASQMQKITELQRRFSDPKYTFKIGVTSVSGVAPEKLNGGKFPSDAELTKEAQRVNARATQYLKEEEKNLGVARAKLSEPGCAGQARYDLRAKGLSTPVQNQGQCGSCWDFAAIAAFESSWKKVNGATIGASEQQILNCAGAAGSCGGGAHSSAFLHLLFQAIPSRAEVPYVAKVQSCGREAPRRYSAAIWGFVGSSGINPSVAEIKGAICEHGAVAAAMNSTDCFQNYTGGVFNEGANSFLPNHVVTLIGWDDAKKAWIVKNSWGTGWGETAGDPSPNPTRGYAYMAYGTNIIGRSAAWVKARKECPNGGEYDAGLCYTPCKPGYHGLGPMCWQNCAEGMIDDGATCRAPISSIAKKSYGRGVGTPMTCRADEEQNGALCYPKCKDGYKGVGPVCWQQCPAGYKDDGATCRKDAHIMSSDNSACPWHDKCGLVGAKGCSKCPSGYNNDGCTCRRDVHIFGKKSYGRGAGNALSSCRSGEEKNGALCYPECKAGYSGAGPVCWERCPSDHRDDGAFCTKGGQVTASKGYGRGVGTIPPL
jgi:C1A family cysteine protease